MEKVLCPKCGSKNLKILTDDKNYLKDVHLLMTGVSLYEMPKLFCGDCGHTWQPVNNNYDSNYLLKD